MTGGGADISFKTRLWKWMNVNLKPDIWLAILAADHKDESDFLRLSILWRLWQLQ